MPSAATAATVVSPVSLASSGLRARVTAGIASAAVMLDVAALLGTVRVGEHLEAPARRFGIRSERLGTRDPLHVLHSQVHGTKLDRASGGTIRAYRER